MTLSIRDFQWTREPAACTVCDDRVEIITRPHTDLWQRTYYHFRNDNAPVFQMETEEKFFLSPSKLPLKASSALTSAALCCIWTATTG